MQSLETVPVAKMFLLSAPTFTDLKKMAKSSRFNVSYLPGRAWPALCCIPASRQTLLLSLTSRIPGNHDNGRNIRQRLCVYVCVWKLSVLYLGANQAQILHHVRLHHLSQQLRVAGCVDEGEAAVRWAQLFAACWNLKLHHCIKALVANGLGFLEEAIYGGSFNHAQDW